VFIRLTRSKTSKNPTVQIVESYRQGKKVRQKVISSLGVVRDDADRERLIHVGHALINKLRSESDKQLRLPLSNSDETREASKKTPSPRFVDPRQLTHVRSTPCGFEDVYGTLSENVGFKKLLKDIDQDSRRDFSVREIIEMLVYKRLEEPASKRRSLYLESIEKGAKPCELHQTYRAMDVLLPFSDKIQKLAYDSATDLLNQKVECFFYDVTTLYFESVLQDEVRDFGFSKDGKFNQTQTLLVLVVTDEGIPVGYEVFSGKIGEVSTFQTAIEKLSKRFEITKCTIVCDRGMMSGANLKFAATDKHMYYIVGEKLRQLPSKFHQTVFDKTPYQQHGEIFIQEIAHPTREGARLILCFSGERAKKDKRDRERLLVKLQKKIEKKNKETKPKELISNRGVRKFVSITGGSVTLNREAIAKEEKWDGFYGIATNHPILTSTDVLHQYKGLWQVEATFRVCKHELRTRPIFHWSPDRIRAHILICFMALVLERSLEVTLKKRNTPLTPINIHDALSHCQKIIFQENRTHRLFEMDTNKPLEAKILYEALAIPWRRPTRELPNPKGNVVSSVLSVKPESLAILGDHL
jgi:transposase